MTDESKADRDVGLTANWGWNGISAGVKSRAFSAWDRLGGLRQEKVGLALEEEVLKRRAVMQGELSIIAAITESAVNKIKADPKFAERALANLYGRAESEQNNKDGVLRHAAAQLAIDEGGALPEGDKAAIDEAFLTRFERYAGDASTEELRERWGRVLAREVVKPGTFSNRVLRVVDEIEPTHAAEFEKLCRFRLGAKFVMCLSEQEFDGKILPLMEADLLTAHPAGKPGAMRFRYAANNEDGFYYLLGDGWGIGYHGPTLWREGHDAGEVLINEGGRRPPRIQVFVLSQVGHAIAQILPEREREVVGELRSVMAECIENEIVLLKCEGLNPDGTTRFSFFHEAAPMDK